MTMTRVLHVAAFVALAGAPRVAAGQSESASVQSAALAEEVRLLIEARLTSFAKGDSAAFHRMIVPGFVHVYDSGWPGSGPKLLQYVARQRSDSANAKVAPVYTVTEVQARREGQVLLAHALVTQQFHVGTRTLASQWRETNALIRSRDHWLFVQHSETPIVALGGYPVAAPVPDSASLAAFVGDYEWWPG
ncbi:MAG: nuclear transport factor 2 family protein, partial [Gemmatimonadaceae bacterium]